VDTLHAAYERLLADLAGDLQAARAVIELAPQAGEVLPPIAAYGATAPDDGDLTWVEWPVHEGSAEIARVRLGFAEGVAPPGPADRRVSQALLELVVLLGLAGWQQHSMPAIQACRRILAVTEEELQHIILDIHDGPVQKLFAASSQVELMLSRMPGMPEEARAGLESELARVAALLQASLDEIKNTLGTLRPPEFRRRPLVSVVRGLIIQHETLTGMTVNLHVEGDLPPVSLPVKIALYRIMQEALSNAYRHARVDSLEVRLVGDDGWVTLEVVDSGPGFEPPPLEGPSGTEREEHIGLRGMRDRAQLVGGQIKLTSHPGQGTRIQARLPGDD
jgi:signal transduction histidine kinase